MQCRFNTLRRSALHGPAGQRDDGIGLTSAGRAGWPRRDLALVSAIGAAKRPAGAADAHRRHGRRRWQPGYLQLLAVAVRAARRHGHGADTVAQAATAAATMDLGWRDSG